MESHTCLIEPHPSRGAKKGVLPASFEASLPCGYRCGYVSVQSQVLSGCNMLHRTVSWHPPEGWRRACPSFLSSK